MEFYSKNLATQLKNARDTFKDKEDLLEDAKEALSDARDDAEDAKDALVDAAGKTASALAEKLRLENQLQAVKDDVNLGALQEALQEATSFLQKQTKVLNQLLAPLVEAGILSDGQLPTNKTLKDALAIFTGLQGQLSQVLLEIDELQDARDLIQDEIACLGLVVTSLDATLASLTGLPEASFGQLWDAGFPLGDIPTPDDLADILREEAQALDLLKLAEEIVDLAQIAFDEVSERLENLLDGLDWDVNLGLDVEEISYTWAVGLQADFGIGYGAPVAISAKYESEEDSAEIGVFVGPGSLLEVFASAIYDIELTVKASVDLFLEIRGDVKIDAGGQGIDIDVDGEGLIELLGFERDGKIAPGLPNATGSITDTFLFTFALEDGTEVSLSETEPLLMKGASGFDVDRNGRLDMTLLDTSDNLLAGLIPDPDFSFDLT